MVRGQCHGLEAVRVIQACRPHAAFHSLHAALPAPSPQLCVHDRCGGDPLVLPLAQVQLYRSSLDDRLLALTSSSSAVAAAAYRCAVFLLRPRIRGARPFGVPGGQHSVDGGVISQG